MTKRFKVEVYAEARDIVRVEVEVDAVDEAAALAAAMDPDEWAATGHIKFMESIDLRPDEASIIREVVR